MALHMYTVRHNTFMCIVYTTKYNEKIPLYLDIPTLPMHNSPLLYIFFVA